MTEVSDITCYQDTDGRFECSFKLKNIIYIIVIEGNNSYLWFKKSYYELSDILYKAINKYLTIDDAVKIIKMKAFL